jgi:hypothetical protein
VTGGSYGERNANVAASAADMMSQAVMNYKQKQNADAVAKAQSSFQQYQQAIQAGDMQTANYIATDPKVVKSWEKYLNEFINKVPGEVNPPQPNAAGSAFPQIKQPQDPRPGALGQINQPGGLAVPRLDPKSQQAQMQAATLAEAQNKAAKEEALTHEAEAHEKLYGVQGNAEVIKANAEVTKAEAEAAAKHAEAEEAKARLDRIPAENAKDRAAAARDYAAARLDDARAKEAVKKAGEAKILAAYNAAAGRIKDERNFESKNLSSLQSNAEKNRSSMGKLIGSDPDTTPEMQSSATRIKALATANSVFGSLQQKVTDGKITVEDAQKQARQAGNLTSDLQVWGGAPADAPPAPKQDGMGLFNADHEVIAVSQGGQWVAP